MGGRKLRYLLDTNICIGIMNGRSERALRELVKHDRSEVGVSSIVVAELMYGVERSDAGRREENLGRLKRFLSAIQVLDFDAAAAQEYGRIRADLEGQGLVIGPNDLLIAAQANSLDAVLVTNNVREFARVEGLEVADWISK